MTKKTIDTWFGVDDAYPLTEERRGQIVDALACAIDRDKITDADIEAAQELLNVAHSKWHHDRIEAPRVPDALEYLQGLASQAQGLLRTLSDTWGHDRESRTRLLVLEVVDDVLSGLTPDELSPERAPPAEITVDGARAVLEALVKVLPKTSEAILAARKANSHLDRMMSGVAEQIFKPRGLSQSYSSPRNGKISHVARVARGLALLLPREMWPPSLATMTERHADLVPEWREAIADHIMREKPDLTREQAVALARDEMARDKNKSPMTDKNSP